MSALERSVSQANIDNSLKVDEASKSLKRKYKLLRNLQRSRDEALRAKYKPIVDPLTSVLKSTRSIKRSKVDEPLFDKSFKHLNDSLNDSLSKEEVEPIKHEEEEEEDSDLDATKGPIMDETVYDYSPPSPPPPLTPRDILIKKIVSNTSAPGEKNLRNMEVSSLHEEANSPIGRKLMDKFIRATPTFAKPYGIYMFTGEWSGEPLDKVYGPVLQGKNGVSLGNSQLMFSDNYILLNDKMYDATPGLFELIFLQSPKNYTDTDFDNYCDIVRNSKVAHHGYAAARPIRTTGGVKYNEIISRIHPPKRTTKTRLPTTMGSGIESIFTNYSPVVEPDDQHPIAYINRTVIPPSSVDPTSLDDKEDANNLVHQLELLLGSINAGNTRLQSRATYLLKLLEERGYIY